MLYIVGTACFWFFRGILGVLIIIKAMIKTDIDALIYKKDQFSGFP